MPVGVETIEETPGSGDLVERGKRYRVRLRMWLNKGDQVRLEKPWNGTLEDDGAVITTIELHRGRTIPGFFYALEGMRMGGTRKVRIPPALAYGEAGIPGIVPPSAVLIAQIELIEPA